MKLTIPTIRPLAETAAIAALYYGTAEVGFLLAVPPGNVTPFWPPSALALAAALLFGYRASVGVWIGSLLVNLTILRGEPGLIAAAAIATGSTLQMLAGAWLIRRTLAGTHSNGTAAHWAPAIPDSARDVLLFVLLTAATSMIASTVGVTSLCTTGFAPWSNVWTLWWTWWVGDYAGILILTPIIIVTTARIQQRPFAEAILFPFATVCLGLSLVASSMIWQAKVYWNGEKLRITADDMVDLIRDAVNQNIGNLIAVEGLFAASEKVTRAKFKQFAGRFLQKAPTTFELTWVPRVRQQERAAYEAAARKDGLADFTFLERNGAGEDVPAPARPEYFPVYYRETVTPERSVLGFNHGSDTERMATFNQARDSGTVVATPPTARRRASSEQKNVLLFKPIYLGGLLPDSIEERQANLSGFMLSVLHMDELIKEVLQSTAYQDVELYFFDVADAEQPQPIAAHRPLAAAAAAVEQKTWPDLAALKNGAYHEVTFNVGGRPWVSVARPGGAFPNALWAWEVWMVILIGAMMSGALLIYLNFRQRSEAGLRRAEEYYRGLFESAPNGMVMIDELGKIVLLNSQIEQQFFYGREELLGRSTEILVPERLRRPNPDRSQTLLFGEIEAGEPGARHELFGRRKDGSEFALEIRLNALQTANGSRVLASLIDISERKRVEDALRHSEVTTNLIIDSAPDAIVAVDAGGHIVRVSKQTENMFGYGRDELIGMDVDRLLPERFWDGHRRSRAEYHAQPRVRPMSGHMELFGLRKDHTEFPVDIMLSPLVIGGTKLFMATIRDITQRKLAEAEIQQLTSTLEERVVERTAQLQHEVAERKNVEDALNQAYAQLQQSMTALEQRNQEVTLLSAMIQLVECCKDVGEAYQVISRHLSQLFPSRAGALYMISASRNLLECVCQWGGSPTAAVNGTFDPTDCWALRRGRTHKVESALIHMLCNHVELGEAMPSSYLCTPLTAHGETLGIVHLKFSGDNGADSAAPDERLLQSVVEQLSLVLGNLRLRETLGHQTARDPLTGLFNRRYMEESLSRELQRATRSGSPLAVAMIDVDHFKRFNDTFGHAAGDIALREVANLLKSKVRPTDVVCRYGGEEFVVISPEITLDVARQRLDRLREELKRLSIKHQGRVLDSITMSVGLAVFPIHAADSEALLRLADEALYRAKKAGRDRVVVSTEGSVESETEVAGLGAS